MCIVTYMTHMFIHLMMRTRFPLLLMSSLVMSEFWLHIRADGLRLMTTVLWNWHQAIKSWLLVVCCLAWHLDTLQCSNFSMWLNYYLFSWWTDWRCNIFFFFFFFLESHSVCTKKKKNEIMTYFANGLVSSEVCRFWVLGCGRCSILQQFGAINIECTTSVHCDL